MLIDIEGLNNNGNTINYTRTDDNVVVFNRPSSLPLKKKIIFSPTLPSTPESYPFRDRSFRSVPVKSHSDLTWDRLASKPPFLKSHSFESAPKKDSQTNAECCSWLTLRWHKYLRKSSPRHDVKRDVSGRVTSLPFVNRRRAATVSSQPASFIEKENKRDWGEERHNDVIYKVILKKVSQETSPTENSTSEQCDGLQYATHKVRFIKGATLPHLVSQLCQSFLDENDQVESNFHTVFFSAYRSFAGSEEVLDLIESEAEKLKKEPCETRIPGMRSIIQVLRLWLDRYFKEDFYKPPHHLLLKRLLNLAENYKEDQELSELFVPSEDQCDFVTFAKSRLQAAEVKGLQEQACENMNSPSIFSDILDETDNVCVEEDSVNMEASRTFLNLLSSQQIAEQLTVKDANLFLRVVPHHCLECVRSKDKPATVKATIEQFNKVTYCVQGTCLCPGLKTSLRAKVVSQWIEVAQVCLELKNFSSFHAIICGLQTHPIYRLKRTWAQVSNNHVNLFEELKQVNIKDSLIKAALSKGSSEKIPRGRKDAAVRRNHTMPSGCLLGTVPYLGTFLTDLTYLHTANTDYVEKNFINFHKMRKEFEMLAQLQLWQASCRSYQQFESDQRFSDWFNSVTLPSDDHAIQLSEEIEPQNTVNLSPISPAPIKRALSEILVNQMVDVSGLSSPSFKSSHRRSPSGELARNNAPDAEQTPCRANGHSVPETPSDQEQRTVNVQIIKRVTFDSESSPESKEMELCSNDRSPAFMKKAFSLFEMENEDVKSFTLMQILPEDKKLVIPETGNVYYAMNSSSSEYSFALIEEGAEVPWERRENHTRTLPTTGRGKKITSRKPTASTSSMSSGVSPMKRSIYKHLSGMSFTSGFYSPVKELRRQESAQDRRDSLKSMTPNPSRRKASADDSLSSSNASYSFSDDSGGESDSSRMRKSIKKLIGKRKGHRRNHSDLGQLSNLKIADALVTPFKLFQPITAAHDTKSSTRFAASESDAVQNGGVTIVRPEVTRNPSVSNGGPELHGQEGKTDQRISKKDPTTPKFITKVLQKRESRSKFYVPFQAADIAQNQSSSSLNSAMSNESKESAFEHEVESRKFSSDSHVLELTLGENEVFGDEIHPPAITVQSPSPQKSPTLKFSNDSKLNCIKPESTEVNGHRHRCASETRTTPL